MSNKTFKGFPYSAAQLSAYAFCLDTFVLSLKETDEVIRYTAEDAEAFRQWLTAHRIRDINDELGSLVYDFYFPKK